MLNKKDLEKAVKLSNRRQYKLYAPAMGFYLVLMAIGVVALTFWITSAFNMEHNLIERIINIAFPSASNDLKDYFTQLEKVSAGGLVLSVFAILPVMYMASHGYYTILLIIRELYGLAVKKAYKKRIGAIVYTFAGITGLILVLSMLAALLALLDAGTGMTIALLIIGLMIVAFPILWLIMWMPARKHIRPLDAIPGAIVAYVGVVLTLLVTIAISGIIIKLTVNYASFASILIVFTAIGIVAKMLFIGVCYNVIYFNKKYDIKNGSVVDKIKDKLTKKKSTGKKSITKKKK